MSLLDLKACTPLKGTPLKHRLNQNDYMQVFVLVNYFQGDTERVERGGRTP